MEHQNLPPQWRVPLLVLGIVSLFFGVLGGLWRLGWDLPLPGTEPASFHGALMAAAFFGSIIGLERAVAHGSRRAYLAPLCAGSGGLATALGAPHILSAALLLAGSAALAGLASVGWRGERAPHRVMSLAGALCGVAGNLLWLAGWPASEVLGAWTAFLVLTIAGERLELSHLRRPAPGVLKLLAAAALLCIAGAIALPLHWRTGAALLGAAWVALSSWLLANDIARRNLRHHGLMRFTAVCLVGGYAWLGVGGLLLPFASPAGFLYDAALHAVFLGFVFAMVIGHAPMVFPAVLRVAVPYTPYFYAHLALLHATLLLRLAGDFAEQPQWRAWGGLGNAAALALFLLMTIGAALRSRSREAVAENE